LTVTGALFAQGTFGAPALGPRVQSRGSTPEGICDLVGLAGVVSTGSWNPFRSATLPNAGVLQEIRLAIKPSSHSRFADTGLTATARDERNRFRTLIKFRAKPSQLPIGQVY